MRPVYFILFLLMMVSVSADEIEYDPETADHTDPEVVNNIEPQQLADAINQGRISRDNMHIVKPEKLADAMKTDPTIIDNDKIAARDLSKAILADENLMQDDATFSKIDSYIEDDITLVNNNKGVMDKWLRKYDIQNGESGLDDLLKNSGAMIESYEGGVVKTAGKEGCTFEIDRYPGATVTHTGKLILESEAEFTNAVITSNLDFHVVESGTADMTNAKNEKILVNGGTVVYGDMSYTSAGEMDVYSSEDALHISATNVFEHDISGITGRFSGSMKIEDDRKTLQEGGTYVKTPDTGTISFYVGADTEFVEDASCNTEDCIRLKDGNLNINVESDLQVDTVPQAIKNLKVDRITSDAVVSIEYISGRIDFSKDEFQRQGMTPAFNFETVCNYYEDGFVPNIKTEEKTQKVRRITSTIDPETRKLKTTSEWVDVPLVEPHPTTIEHNSEKHLGRFVFVANTDAVIVQEVTEADVEFIEDRYFEPSRGLIRYLVGNSYVGSPGTKGDDSPKETDIKADIKAYLDETMDMLDGEKSEMYEFLFNKEYDESKDPILEIAMNNGGIPYSSRDYNIADPTTSTNTHSTSVVTALTTMTPGEVEAAVNLAKNDNPDIEQSIVDVLDALNIDASQYSREQIYEAFFTNEEYLLTTEDGYDSSARAEQNVKLLQAIMQNGIPHIDGKNYLLTRKSQMDKLENIEQTPVTTVEKPTVVISMTPEERDDKLQQGRDNDLNVDTSIVDYLKAMDQPYDTEYREDIWKNHFGDESEYDPSKNNEELLALLKSGEADLVEPDDNRFDPYVPVTDPPKPTIPKDVKPVEMDDGRMEYLLDKARAQNKNVDHSIVELLDALNQPTDKAHREDLWKNHFGDDSVYDPNTDNPKLIQLIKSGEVDLIPPDPNRNFDVVRFKRTVPPITIDLLKKDIGAARFDCSAYISTRTGVFTDDGAGSSILPNAGKRYAVDSTANAEAIADKMEEGKVYLFGVGNDHDISEENVIAMLKNPDEMSNGHVGFAYVEAGKEPIAQSGSLGSNPNSANIEERAQMVKAEPFADYIENWNNDNDARIRRELSEKYPDDPAKGIDNSALRESLFQKQRIKNPKVYLYDISQIKTK